MDSFTGTVSDGRVVVWGGTDELDGLNRLLTDGGIYDPETATWETIPPAPVAGSVQSMRSTQLADDRLFVLGAPAEGPPGPLDAAVYDLATQRWTEVEPPPSIELWVEGIAWTGDTLVLARFWSGADVDKVAQYTEPVVERWSYETGEWETGATPPLSNRFGANVAFDGERLGVWGGARQEVEIGALATGAELVSDGAIYDVAADRWEPMAAGPLPPMMQGAAVWLESGRLAVAGGVVEDTSGSSPASSSVTGMHLLDATAGAVFDPTSQRWSPLPDPFQDRPRPPQPGIFVIYASEYSLTATDGWGSGSGGPTSYYDEVTQSWVPAPLPDIHTIDGTLVATSDVGDEAFEVQVLAGSVWEEATEAPFLTRMDAGVAVVGGDLLVVGGAEGPNLDVTGDAWILRFDR
jgi:hypothetical protein